MAPRVWRTHHGCQGEGRGFWACRLRPTAGSDVDLIGQVHQGFFEGAAFGRDVPDRILELIGINLTSHTNRMLAVACLRYRVSMSNRSEMRLLSSSVISVAALSSTRIFSPAALIS